MLDFTGAFVGSVTVGQATECGHRECLIGILVASGSPHARVLVGVDATGELVALLGQGAEPIQIIGIDRLDLGDDELGVAGVPCPPAPQRADGACHAPAPASPVPPFAPACAIAAA